MRLVSIENNEDEMLVLHTTAFKGKDIPPELKKEFEKFLRMMHCMIKGTLLSGELFPILWENIRMCGVANLGILKKCINKRDNGCDT